MAVGQLAQLWLIRRHREQAPSHRLTSMYQMKGGLLWLWLWLWLLILILGAPSNTLAGIRHGFGG